MSFLICGIYKDRPEVCRTYPRPSSYLLSSCGYRFFDQQRVGGCYLECQASCCLQTRLNGEPDGSPLSEIAGGEPCRYLIAVDDAPEGAILERLNS